MSDFWARLGWHVHRGEVDATVQLLHKATEEQRYSAAADLEAYVRKTPPEKWWSKQKRLAAVVVAAIGCLPSAARAATLLGRTVVADSLSSVPVASAVEVARLRGTPFMADLGHRLANHRQEAAVLAGYELAATLVVAAGSAPPETDLFVRGWVRHHLFAREMLDPRNKVLDRVRDDPMLTALVPRLFEIDGIGTELTSESWQKQGTFATALATLAEEGRLDRTVLLDGCVGRLLRGDGPGALRAFVVLVDQLAPTVDETAARTLDLVRLLPDAPSTVAGLAQRLLRRVDDAGQLEVDTLLKVSEQVLARTEKGLVRTQLRWLGAVAKREPDRAAEIAGVVSLACAHPAADIQELARKLGGEPPAAPEPSVAETPAAAPAAAMPAPISSAGELAEETAALFSAPLSVVSFERVLAGLVAMRATDPDGVTDVLTPMLGRLDPTPEFDRQLPSPADLNDALRSAIGTAAGATGRSSWQRLVSVVRDTIRGVARRDSVVPAPQRALVLRAGEVCARLKSQPVPNLVATPTSVNGHLDAGTLVDRLAAAARDGWEPWRFDLEQALLRLPREVDADLQARARKLGSAAGTRLADWLTAGGLPDPVPTRITQPSAAVYMPEWRAVVALAPGGPGSGLLADELCTHVPPKGAGVWLPLTEALWPAVLPGHRDVIAAWALPTVAAAADQDQPGSKELLPLLAECTGPVGPALTIALAYGLAAKDTAERVAAVDAVLALAASLDPVLLGQEVGALAAGGVVKLNRGIGALTDTARAGAPDLVRATVFAALPALLATTPPARGTPDLLALAAETVTTTGWRGNLPEVTELAGRPGKSRSHVEARRLARLVGPA